MANEINVSASLSASKNGVTIRQSASKSADMAGAQMISNVQIIGFAAPEAILLGDVTTLGYLFLKNMDETNFITILNVDEPLSTLLPGDLMLIKAHASATFNAQGSVAACNLLVEAVEL